MNRLERLFGILLALRSGAPVSADALAARLEVSRRTIYRDVETLSALGVPVFARRGYRGGLQLLEGYFLPPLMLTTAEAAALLMGLTLLRSLRATPVAAELDTAEQKLLAAVPERLRATLARANTLVGFETLAGDVFHPEPEAPPLTVDGPADARVSAVASAFWQAVLDRRSVRLDYHSPYQAAAKTYAVEPLGLFWDRERWYLAGRRLEGNGRTGLYRADRVADVRAGAPLAEPAERGAAPFDVRTLLGRRWLAEAMADWRQMAPTVRVRLTTAQAQRLRQDWYYSRAHFSPTGAGEVLTFSEEDRAVVFELLRWLGPGAELLEPAEWRGALRAELSAMAAEYAERDTPPTAPHATGQASAAQ
jgi:predicted DNA-binding transcriptional regulator YafY